MQLVSPVGCAVSASSSLELVAIWTNQALAWAAATLAVADIPGWCAEPDRQSVPDAPGELGRELACGTHPGGVR